MQKVHCCKCGADERSGREFIKVGELIYCEKCLKGVDHNNRDVATKIYQYYMISEISKRDLKEALGYFEPDGPYFKLAEVNKVAFGLEYLDRSRFIENMTRALNNWTQ